MRNSKALSRTLRLFTAATEGPSVESLGFALNTTYPDYSTLAVDSTTNESIAHLQLTRSHKGNSFNMLQWNEYKQFYNDTNNNRKIRCVVLSGNGKHFSTGMDLSVFGMFNDINTKHTCEGRKREALEKVIKWFQSCVTSPEQCRVPVIAAVHGGCIGGAIDIITACDLRYCTKDAFFCIKETDLGMVADVGMCSCSVV